ncbi:hypothetical protein HDU92_002201 [Lobulomyces angularis]|nr:hypothetical protein HDU92_002201 [Lobulomyces angularis]
MINKYVLGGLLGAAVVGTFLWNDEEFCNDVKALWSKTKERYKLKLQESFIKEKLYDVERNDSINRPELDKDFEELSKKIESLPIYETKCSQNIECFPEESSNAIPSLPQTNVLLSEHNISDGLREDISNDVDERNQKIINNDDGAVKIESEGNQGTVETESEFSNISEILSIEDNTQTIINTAEHDSVRLIGLDVRKTPSSADSVTSSELFLLAESHSQLNPNIYTQNPELVRSYSTESSVASDDSYENISTSSLVGSDEWQNLSDLGN